MACRRKIFRVKTYLEKISARRIRTLFWTLILSALIGVLVTNEATKGSRQIAVFQIEEPKRPPTPSTTKKPFDPFEIPDKLIDKGGSDVDLVNNVIGIRESKNVTDFKENTHRKKKIQHENNKRYKIYWYNPPPYLRNKPEAMNCGFESCEYNNCDVTFNRSDVLHSDVVIFDGRWVWEKPGFVRPKGQIWIFAAHENPLTFEELGGWWKNPNWRDQFNWTMTYDKDNTDIFLPYGELRKHPKFVNRDYRAIAKSKTNGALMINSHCNTSSKREDFVSKLQKYMPVEVLGSCGKPWNCGTHFVHDDCFLLLNTTYRFFLAFENTFCNQYFSEKLFENYDYDILLVTRGGSFNNARELFPKRGIISTDSFKSIEGLAKFLGKLSVNDYAEMLKIKSQYYFSGYKYVYQRAMCDLCDRLNKQEKYKKSIKDIVDWAYGRNPCRAPTDIV